MTCIDRDIKLETSNNVKNNRIPGTNFDMVYYADDTIIFSKNMQAIEELISLTERISATYGLKLNKDKCVNLNMNTEEQQQIQDHKPILSSTNATYLGNVLNNKADPHAEITQKIQEVNKTLWKLQDYWKATNANTKWKILIFDAVIKSKLLYGLETTQLPKPCQTRVNAFQVKGLRRILGFKHTNWDREATNELILSTATQHAFRTGSPKNIARNAGRKIELYSQAYIKRKQKLLGHIIRTGNEDPLRQVALHPDSAKPIIFVNDKGKRRSGQPRHTWAYEASKRVWKKHSLIDAPKINAAIPCRRRPYKASTRQCKFVHAWAQERKF